MDIITILLAAVGLVAGAAIGFFAGGAQRLLTMGEYEEKAQNKMEKAAQESEKIHHDALERSQGLKTRMKEDEERLKEQYARMENLITSKEEQVKKREDKVNGLNGTVQSHNKEIEAIRASIEQLDGRMTEKLSEKVGVSLETARREVMELLARDLELMKEERIHKQDDYLQDEKVRIAKNMIVDAIQRYSAPTSVEKKSLAVMVQRDEHKARIIGPNASFLALIEELTECDIILNDAPNMIIISCFDLVKKHVARELIMKLIKERYVDEQIIRKKLADVNAEMEKTLIRIGRETVNKLEVKNRKFTDEFYRIVGRLQFRTSYGQNILKHCFEVGYFTLMLGAELGLNIETCKVGGFFHDLGKAIDHEVGEPHDILSKRIMEEHKCFSHDEIHAAWAHHDAVPQETAEALLVKAGDAISAGRPGARQETLEKYIERIRAIESIANSYEGVSKSYAISAGREVRVIVEPAVLEDEHLADLASHIAKDIEEGVAYPGKIKVNVIRRTQSIDVAKPK